MRIVEELEKAGTGLAHDDMNRRTGIVGSGSLSKELREHENHGGSHPLLEFTYCSFCGLPCKTAGREYVIKLYL